MMRKLLVCSAVLVALSSFSHAGFYDSVKSVVGTTGGTDSAASPDPVDSSTIGQTVDLAMGLIPNLTRNLGVSEAQAEGGVGALMQLAKGQLSGGEFSKVSAQLPGMETLLAAAPALSGKSSGGLGGVMGSLGGMSAGIGGLAKVTQQFEALGLSPDMISRFAELIVGYFRGGEGNTAALLEKGLSAALGS